MEPEEGKWCEEAILHYVNELKLLQENGIKVCPTLFHFTEPEWFYQKVAPYFAPYDKLDNIMAQYRDFKINKFIRIII